MKSIAVAVGSIVYGYGAIAAASDLGVNTPNTLRGLDIPQKTLESYKIPGVENTLQGPLKSAKNVVRGGVNRQLQPLEAKQKFVPEKDLTGEHTYIVRLKDSPVATYDGRISGLKATALSQNNASKTTKLYGAKNANKQAIKAYQDYLLQKQSSFLNKADSLGVPLTARIQYTNAINGMSVKMTQEQAAQLAQMPEVLKIQRSRVRQLFSDVGPGHIGADKVWAGDTSVGVPFDGEGMIVGIIDTGINTDHESFADIGGDGFDHTNPWGEGIYVGDCTVAGQEHMCNDKLIGVRSYDVITDVYDADEFQDDPNKPSWIPNELIRPRNGEDYNGHGSHVAGTTAGNVIYNAPLLQPSIGDGDGTPTGFEFERVSGVAPHANIIAYQVCYPGGSGDPYVGCPDEASIAAIEHAIEDGVDVLNYSIGGAEPFPWEDATELAFLSAREAGINVAVAAGNAGNYFIAHTAPWETIVAASNHGREISVAGKSVTGMSGGDTPAPDTLDASGISESYTGNIVLAANYGDQLCSEAFAPGTFNGEIVVCQRGDLARIAKAENVLAGGAGGFILYNRDAYGDEANTVNDAYPLPGAHIDYWQGNTLTQWLSSGTGHMATISASEISTSINPDLVDVIANFSSRGPAITFDNFIAPSVAAPGVNVHAAYADEMPFTMYPAGTDWAAISGTSMASPHVAGALTLVQQAHPDWTPTEVQSALQMTATPARVTDWNGNIIEANMYDAGSGVINVANAVNAGLIMDESIENFIDANPRNGGDVRNLNLPQVMDESCRQKCTWIRTVKATRDGTWTTSTETGEYSVKLTVMPETFSLKAGEIQTIMIQGEVLDSQTRIGGSELEVHGKIFLTPDNDEIPSVMWPAALRFDHGNLPTKVDNIIHRNTGKEVIGGLRTSAIQDFTSRIYQPVKADIHEFTIPQDDDPFGPLTDGLVEDSDHVIWLDVPANSTRLMAEVLERKASTAANPWEQGIAAMLIGIDANGDGVVQPQDEAICWSNAAYESNWCNINNPDEGKYWVLVHNYPEYEMERPEDTWVVATGVVSGEIADNMSVEGPASTDGLTPYEVAVNWDIADLAKGDILYTAFDLGTDPANAGSLGFVPVRLERGVDEVSTTASQTQARAGDMVQIQLNVVANKTGADRSINLAATMPQGATLMPGSVAINGKFDATIEELDNGFSLAATQFDSSDIDYEYIMTTNADDAMCRTPDVGGNSDGGYINLHDFGFGAQFGGSHFENMEIPFSAFWRGGANYSLYDNQQYSGSDSIIISPMGYVKLDNGPLFWPVHLPFPYHSFPDQLIGVMWKGGFLSQDGASMGVPFMPGDDENNSGITIATTANGTMIIEWDNARGENYVGSDPITWEPIFDSIYGESYDFELILNMNTRHGKGQYEIIKAYDNIDFGTSSGEGSIGLQGFHGARSWLGPLYGYRGTEFAFNGLKDKIHDDLIICYDLMTPEASMFDVSFWVRINEEATGSALVFSIDNQVEGLDTIVAEQVIEVPSNIKVGAINDQTIAEGESVTGIMVAYSDSDQGVNTITVTGDHITATVHGHESGSMIDVTPSTNFSGETEVFVTVSDSLYPSDSDTTSFMLTVIGEQDAPVAAAANASLTITEGYTAVLDGSASYDPDGDSITYSWEGPGTIADANAAVTSVSGLSVGNHQFTLTVSDGNAQTSTTVAVNVRAEGDNLSSSSSGSLFYLLALLGLVGFSRRTR